MLTKCELFEVFWLAGAAWVWTWFVVGCTWVTLGWVTTWFTGWVITWFTGWVTTWFTGWATVWVTVWICCCVIGWVITCLIGWLITWVVEVVVGMTFDCWTILFKLVE